MRLPFFLIMVLILVSPVCALTVSSSALKWNEINVIGSVTHDILITNNPTISTVEFSDSLRDICTASPGTIAGSGNVQLTCSPKASVIGYARVAEVSESTVQTGIRIPIALSTTGQPVTEAPTAAPTIEQTAEPTSAAVMNAPVQQQPDTPPNNDAPEDIAGIPLKYFTATALIIAGVFGVVLIYDYRRGKKQ